MVCVESNVKKRMDKRFLILSIILLAGTLIYSGTLFILNICIPPGQTPYITAAGTNLLETRLLIRRISEITYGICGATYLIGTAVLLWSLVKSESVISKKMLLLLPAFTIMSVFLCVMPFSLLDETFAVDYFVPILNMVVNIPLLFIAAWVATLIKRRSGRRKN